MENKKYCKFCGELIDCDSVFCKKCGKRVEPLRAESQDTQGTNVADEPLLHFVKLPRLAMDYPKNKWVALFLCIFTVFGHKFYEGKNALGFLYFFTCGLFLIGWAVDIITLLQKPDTYYF